MTCPPAPRVVVNTQEHPASSRAAEGKVGTAAAGRGAARRKAPGATGTGRRRDVAAEPADAPVEGRAATAEAAGKEVVAAALSADVAGAVADPPRGMQAGAATSSPGQAGIVQSMTSAAAALQALFAQSPGDAAADTATDAGLPHLSVALCQDTVSSMLLAGEDWGQKRWGHLMCPSDHPFLLSTMLLPPYSVCMPLPLTCVSFNAPQVQQGPIWSPQASTCWPPASLYSDSFACGPSAPAQPVSIRVCDISCWSQGVKVTRSRALLHALRLPCVVLHVASSAPRSFMQQNPPRAPRSGQRGCVWLPGDLLGHRPAAPAPPPRSPGPLRQRMDPVRGGRAGGVCVRLPKHNGHR